MFDYVVEPHWGTVASTVRTSAEKKEKKISTKTGAV
jgi:hypothetical protein